MVLFTHNSWRYTAVASPVSVTGKDKESVYTIKYYVQQQCMLVAHQYARCFIKWHFLWARFLTADFAHLHCSPVRSPKNYLLTLSIVAFLALAVKLYLWRPSGRTVLRETVCEGVRTDDGE